MTGHAPSRPVGFRSPDALPRLPHPTLELARVRERLDRGAGVTVVRGLQGYGKTTQLVSWLRDQPATTVPVWVTARPTSSAEEIRRRVRHQLGDSSGESRSFDLGAAVRSMPADHRLVVVFDGAQHMVDHDLLAQLIQAVAGHERLRLIVCGRGHHPVEQMALGVVDVVGVSPHALLFTADEIVELGRLLGVTVSGEQAGELSSVLGGWPAAVRLVLDGLDGRGGVLPFSRAQDYLRNVVLPGIVHHKALHEAALFCLAHRPTRGMIRDIAGPHDHERVVAAVESSGLAERHYLEDDVELTLPSFVRTGLRRHLAATDVDATRDMHRKLARWYARRADLQAHAFALEHAAAGRDWAQLDDIWTAHSVSLCMSEPAVVRSVLRALPSGVLAARPSMQMALAMVDVVTLGLDSDADGRSAALQVYLDAARTPEPFALETLSLTDLLHVGTARMIGLRLAGAPQRCDALGDIVQPRLDHLLATGVAAGERLPWYQLQRGLTATILDRPDDAMRWYRLSWTHRDTSARWVQANAAANMSLTSALHGDASASRTWLARYAECDTAAEWGHYLTGIGAHVAAGLLALDALDEATCRRELDHLGDGSEPVELWQVVAYLAAQYGLTFGDPQAALARLDAACAQHGTNSCETPLARVLLDRARADLLLATGNVDAAWELLREHPRAEHPVVVTATARALLQHGELAAAAALVARSLVRSDIVARERTELLVVAAQAAHRCGDRDQSRIDIDHALALYQQTRTVRAFAPLDPDERASLLDRDGIAFTQVERRRLDDQAAPYPVRPAMVTLTRREKLLAAELVGTASRRAIADKLYVSANTVRNQLATLYRKLGVNSREQALARLRELEQSGAITSPPAD